MERSQLHKVSKFMVIGAIPRDFHSSDLRAHFSQFVERKAFSCFHYKHRPEVLKAASSKLPSATDGHSAAISASEALPSQTNCCIVAVVNGLGEEFIKSYSGKNWSRPGGELLARRARIHRLDVATDSTPTGKEMQEDLCVSSGEQVPWTELAVLPELNPPNAMPQGNVGTPLSVFMELIRTCKLPAHVIKKLRLEFPKSRSAKRYGAVAHDYGTATLSGQDEDSDALPSSSRQWQRSNGSNSDEENEEDSIPSDDEHDAEEWERYEALHDDVDKQERTKERLFENEMEVVWDKGSSGLVFYTDANYWDQQEGDFDEKCATEDDWDVDTSIYYDADGGDRSAQELRDMAREKRLRSGEEVAGIGGFEKYTKGIGKKVLKRSGWKEGSGVGASKQGITEPVDTEGQHPLNKRGLGYRGEKLGRGMPFSKQRKANRDIVISTVYDKRDDSIATDSATSKAMKYRAKESLQGRHKFLDGGTLKPSSSDKTQP